MLGMVASPYILHLVVLDCSCYFLNWTDTWKGDFAKSVCEPGDATNKDNVETYEESKDIYVHF